MNRTVASIAALVLLALSAAAATAQEPDEEALRASLDDGITLDRDKFRLRIGGRAHLDAYAYDEDNRKPGGIRLQSLVLDFAGDYGDCFDFLFRPDLIGTDEGDRNFRDAWIRYTLDPAFRVTAGHFKVGYGSEYASSIDNLAMPGRSFVSYLNSFYDAGVQLDGSLWQDTVYWAAWATGGVGYNLEGTRTDDPVFGLRAVVRPLAQSGVWWLEGFAIGTALSHSPSYKGRIHLATPLESTVFHTEKFRGDKALRRQLEIAYHAGPVRLRYEWTELEITDVTWGGTTDDIDQNGSWMAEAAWAVTGQHYAYREGRELGLEGIEPFDPAAGRYGAVEAAIRYSNADIDRDLFIRGLTAYDPSTQEVRTFTAAVSWYPRANMRAMLGFVNVIADDRLTTFKGTHRDRSFVLRLQVDF